MTLTIGLFGTCDNSKWRDRFIARYDEKGIAFFNPVVENWTPDHAVNEAFHLQNDDIILFPVTGESFGFGSLGEIGFAALSVLKPARGGGLPDRHLVVYLPPEVHAGLKTKDAKTADLSRRARALVRAHLDRAIVTYGPERFHVVSDLEEMFELSVKLYQELSLRWGQATAEFSRENSSAGC